MTRLKRAATLTDVAELSGVSRATVSRVVNSSKRVDPEVAARVRVAIQELGYVPNSAARSLITRRTDMVALIAGEPDARFFHDPFFEGIARGAAQELGEVDMRLMMLMIQTAEDLDRVQRYLLGRPVDGVLVISEHGANQIAEQVATAQIPVVLGGRPTEPQNSTLAYVDNENEEGARLAAEVLLQRGCRNVGMIAGPQDMTAGIDRLKGFTSALGGSLPPERLAIGDFTVASGVAGMERLLARAPDLDGVFAASDLMALGAMQVLRREGRRIPRDVAVVGFDDIDLAASSVPPLTTIRQDPVAQGRMMVRLLLQELGRTADLSRAARLSLPGSGSVVLPVRLIRRESA